MSRNAKLLGALVLLSGLLWLAVAWPTSGVDERAATQTEQLTPTPTPAPPPLPAPTGRPVTRAPAASPAAPPLAAPETPVAPPIAPRVISPRRMFERDQGPVAEYKQIYDAEPRASSAIEIESSVRDAFSQPGMAPGLFKSVLCRQTVCKLQLEWSAARLGAYVAGLTRLMSSFTAPAAVSPQGAMDDDGVRPIDMYLKLKPPDQRSNQVMVAPPVPSAAEAR